MRFHKLATDGPIVITVTSAKLEKGPKPQFPPQLVLRGSDESGEVQVPLSAMGAFKQFHRLGIGEPHAEGRPIDTEMPAYHGTFKLTLSEFGTRIEKIADADWERIVTHPPQYSTGTTPPAPAAVAPKPVAAPAPAAAATAPSDVPRADPVGTAAALYEQCLDHALRFAAQIGDADLPIPDVNSIAATLMIHAAKRGG